MKIINSTFKILLLLLLFAHQLSAQTMQIIPGTTPPFTPTNLLQQVFLGDGVKILNISYTGDPNAVGYFKTAAQDIGIQEGVLMSSGFANSIAVPSNNSGSSTGATSGGSDPDLVSVINGTPVQNASVYTIDFIPSSDTLTFNFVFASEEYPEFVCSFNDAFGFFLSGPGIVGPYTNMAKNIALVPGTITPIVVGTINNGTAVGSLQPCVTSNSQYYVNNMNVPAPGQSAYKFQFDGFTTVLTATAVVQPCSTYRIKLAVGDASDQSYDTAVFLEGNSFGTNGLRAFTETPSLTNSIAEGCAPGVINFELDAPADGNYTLSYSLGGSAIMGVDYDPIPLTAVIPNGQTSLQIPIHAIADNVIEGIDTIEVYINITPCLQDTFYIYIEDAILEVPSVTDTTICFGDTVTLDATINTPIPSGFTLFNDSTFIVDDGSIPSYINVSGIPMFGVQTGTIDSVCVDIDHFWTSDIDLYLVAPNGQFLELSTDNGGGLTNTNVYVHTCFTPTATIPISAATPPFTGEYQPEGNWSGLFGAPVNGLWKLQLVDDGLGFDATLTRWSISFSPAYGYDYQWNTANNISCLDCPITTVYPDTTTDYIINITDSYGCTNSDTATITVGYTLPAPVATCDGATTNTLDISWTTVPDATGYLLSIDGGGFTPVTASDTTYTLTGVAPNTTVMFEVQAVGSFCPPNGIDTVFCTTLPCSLTGTLVNTVGVTCAGMTDGSATLSAINGFGDYYFSINNGAPQTNNGAFINLTNGGYQAIISDDDNCADTIAFTITAPAGVMTTTTNTITSCFGGNDGTAVVTANGGTPGYLYNWSTTPAQMTPNAANLSAGTYYVTVTDANNCFVMDTVTIGQPTPVTSSSTTTIVSCAGGSDGTATVTPTGGTGTYTYAWSTTPVQTLATATNLSIGIYYVTITDANNCTGFDTVTITEQPAMVLSNTTTLVSCSGGTDGTATVTATGGAGGYTFAWNTSPAQFSATATGLTTGAHYVTVTDINGCTAIDTAIVTANNPIILSSSTTLAACLGINDGTATVTASGGAGGYLYQWGAGANNQTTATATALGYGNYIVTVTDANSCFDTISAFVQIATTLTSTTTGTDVSCFGGNDGTATITPANGVAPYNYTWSATGAPNAATINTLAAGTYQVTATDVNGCYVTDNVTIIQPQNATLTMGQIGVSCNGGADGSANVTVTGATAPYTYQWSTTPPQFNATATNLAADNYTVTVTDANSCTYTNTITVTEPTALALVMNLTAVNCFGGNDGKGWVTVTGGSAPYNYTWNNSPASLTDTLPNAFAGNYTVTVTDNNGCQAIGNITIPEPAAALSITLQHSDLSCYNGTNGTATVIASGGTGLYTYNWSNNMTTANINGLTAGTYYVAVNDQNGCTVIDSVTLTQPTALVLVADATGATCHNGTDGSASVAVSGGTPDALGNYSYSWNTSPVQTNDTATGLIGGQNYLVVVTDDNGCTANETVSIINPANITLTTTTTNVACFGDMNGTATVTAVGGTLPYTYQWDANASNQTGATATGLGIGSYSVTVTDINGCFNLATVSIIQPNEVFVSFNAFDVACKGDATGTAFVQASGGIPPYAYQWEASAGGDTLQTASNLSAGIYRVSISDVGGCTLVDSITIGEPAAVLDAFIRTGNVTCYGDRNGDIIILASGGTAPYQYGYDTTNFTNASHLSGLFAGYYTAYIKDARGCIYQQDSLFISEPLEMTVDLGADISILLSEDTVLMPVITNGVQPFNFLWTPLDSVLTCQNCLQPQVIGLQDRAHYYLQVTDANGCVAIDEIFIDVIKPRIVYIASGFTPNNDGVNDWLFVQGDHNAVKVTSFLVYDRWGELIFENKDFGLNDPNNGWDGKFKGDFASNGVYGWIVEVEFSDGVRKVYKGNTTLIR